MSKSLQQVCATYLQCWVQWVVILIYFVLCLAAVLVGDPRTGSGWVDVSPKPPQPAPKVVAGRSESLDRASRLARTISWRVALRSPSSAVASQPFPNVNTLEINGMLKSSVELQVLRSMPHLQALTFSGNLPSRSLQFAAELPQLQYLRVPRLENNRGLPQLRRLSQLQILDIGQIDDHSRVLDEICQLPNLNTLVLPGQSASSFQPAEWERLRSLPRLKKLYLRGTQTGPIEDQIEIRRVQQVLPHIKVRPAEVARRRLATWNVINGASTLIWAALAVQLLTQFSHAGSRLIPNYSRDHLIVAVSIMALTTFAHVMILWNRDVSFVASIAASLAAPGLLWWVVALTLLLTDERNLARTLSPIMPATMFWAVPIWGAFVMNQFLGPVDWFLQGEHPFLAIAMVVMSLISPLLVFRRLPRLHLVYAESEAGVPPLSMDFKALRKWNEVLTNSQPQKKRWWFVATPISRLDRQLARPKGHHLSRLWIAGNATNGLQIALRAAWMIVLIVLGNYFLTSPTSEQRNLVLSTVQIWVPIAVIFLEGAMLTSLANVWRVRYPMLGYELLHPVNKRTFVRQLFVAIGRDLLPLLATHLLLAGLVTGSVAQRGLPPLFIPVVLCYCLFHGLAMYASQLLLLSVRGEIKFGMVLGLAFILFYFAANHVTSGITTPESWHPVWSMILFVAGSVLAAASVLGLQQYWEDLELA